MHIMEEMLSTEYQRKKKNDASHSKLTRKVNKS